MVNLFLKPLDRVDWIDNKSTARKKWRKMIVKDHPECKNWVVCKKI